MPQFSLPQLSADFERVAACLMVDTVDPALLKWVEKNALRDVVASYEDGGEKRWVEVTISQWKDEDDGPSTVHLHVEFSRTEFAEEPSKPVKKLLKAISEFIEMAEGEEEGFCAMRGYLRVPRASIPEHGMIAKLLGFSKRSCGVQFSLTSAVLDIEDDAMDKLMFRYDDEDNTVLCQLWSSGFVELSSEYLAEFTKLMEIGADCFVFERVSREQANA